MTVTAAACSSDDGGGGSGGGSTEEFCSAVRAFRAQVDAADSADLAAYVRQLKDAASDLAAVGVPDDIPADAEQGFDLTIRRIEDLADDATQEDFTELGDVPEDDQRKLDSLEDYYEDACPS